MFVDSAKITICSGRGGDGAVSFRREPFVPDGGPDGGNGGKGGDVIFEADRNLRTLMDFKYKKKYVAEAGQGGMKRNKYGKKGQDLIIRVPVGTVVFDTETGKIMQDLVTDKEQFVAAIGGKGGLGNSNYKNSMRQAPNFAEAGSVGNERLVTLELKLIADVGLIGFPNVGKSTLLSVSSSAKPKIADYHFTTLVPNLGVVELANTEFVLADIPGLIEGAAKGAGLGFDFLKHVERTRVLIHVIDASGSEERNPLEDFLKINAEIGEYSQKLISKAQIVALNKIDLTDQDSEAYRELTDYLTAEGYAYFPICAATNQGVHELLNAAAAVLDRVFREESEEDLLADQDRIVPIRTEDEPDYRVVNIETDNGVYILSGKQLKKIFNSTNFNDYGSLRYLYNHLKRIGVIKQLKKMGLEEGDTVRIYGFEFEYTDE
ncbi:MAG: GTPase ObgE [Clostridiales Family XIII bacterium]|jgi:GTP-binding protein|nr:GTPase ObgE [Clostridiales Family XIII bacterium]